MLGGYDRLVRAAVRRAIATLAGFLILFALTLALWPRLGLSFFPRTDAGQFVINLKAPSGTRLALTEGEVAKVEKLIREIVRPEDLGMIVSNIGSAAGFSAIYTSNSPIHTATAPVAPNQKPQIRNHHHIA